MVTSRRMIVYGAKKLMDNEIAGNGEKCCSVVVITIIFLCFDVKVQFLTYETTTSVAFKLKTIQSMTTYLGQYNFKILVKPHRRERHLAKVGKMVPYMCHFNRLYFM